MTVLGRCALVAVALALPLGADDGACQPGAPCYSAAGVVNSASYASGWLGPNTFASIFGVNLSFVSASGTPDSEGSSTSLEGVRVYVNSRTVYVSYVSPDQVNFAVPPATTGDTVTVQLSRDSAYGPMLTLPLHDSAPALFQLDVATAIAAHQDWSLVTGQSPAHAGELVVLYATGLGQYQEAIPDFQRPVVQDWIARRAEFKVLLDGQPAETSLVTYVGAAPVSIGFCQINLWLPAGVGRNPEIRIALGERLSPPGILLPVQ
jgi:uncharacterized protein (TIGR03437 family)